MPLILKCVVPKPTGGLMTMADESVSSSVDMFETLAAARLPKFWPFTGALPEMTGSSTPLAGAVRVKPGCTISRMWCVPLPAPKKT